MALRPGLQNPLMRVVRAGQVRTRFAGLLGWGSHLAEPWICVVRK